MRVACLQMNSGPDVNANLKFIAEQTAIAADQGVRLLQLPENYAQMPARASEQVKEVASQGRIQDFLKQLASTHDIALVAGALPINDPDKLDQNPYARCLAIETDGSVKAQYDKLHLFNVDLPDGSHYRESDRFSEAEEAQNNLVVVDLSGVRLGLSICYDLRFPEQYRALVDRGAELISVPSAFTYDTGKVHWKTLLQARAVENLCFVFAAAQTGTHASGRQTWGHSMIIGPWGDILAQADESPGLIMADIDLKSLQQLRQRFPALTHRRLGLNQH